MMHLARSSSSMMLQRRLIGTGATRGAFRGLTTKNPDGTPENPVVIVTGASRGIGRAIACTLADAGCKVIVNYAVNEKLALDVVEELKVRSASKSGTAIAIKANVANSDEVKAMFTQTILQFGKVDILINNAGITRDMLAMRMSPEDFTSVIDINLNGVFFCAQEAFTSSMLRQKRGRIINIASIIGQIGNTGQANYAAAKGGVIGLTRSLAKEFGSRGITVNAVCPGYIESEMTQNLPNTEAYLKNIPLRRFGTLEEVAGLVKFLALDPAAAYMTGHCFNIDGGMAIGAT